MLPMAILAPIQADIGGAYDLEGLDVFQHAVLMDAAFMQGRRSLP